MLETVAKKNKIKKIKVFTEKFSWDQIKHGSLGDNFKDNLLILLLLLCYHYNYYYFYRYCYTNQCYCCCYREEVEEDSEGSQNNRRGKTTRN